MLRRAGGPVAVGLPLALALVLAAGGVAWADPSDGMGDAIRTGPDTVYLEAESPGRPARPRRGGAGDSGCVAVRLGPNWHLGDWQLSGPADPASGGIQEGAWYEYAGCRNDNLNGARWIPAGDPAPPADPAVLAQSAWDQLQAPAPVLRTSPPNGQDAVVNLPTWLWIDPASFAPVSETVSAGGVTVTATATPTRVVWDMGDGTTVTCQGPGTPYVPGVSDPKAPSPDCGHTYRRSSESQPSQHYRITATVVWTAAWTVTGGSGGGELPDLTTSAATELRVVEFQALNTRAAERARARGQ